MLIFVLCFLFVCLLVCLFVGLFFFFFFCFFFFVFFFFFFFVFVLCRVPNIACIFELSILDCLLSISMYDLTGFNWFSQTDYNVQYLEFVDIFSSCYLFLFPIIDILL